MALPNHHLTPGDFYQIGFYAISHLDEYDWRVVDFVVGCSKETRGDQVLSLTDMWTGQVGYNAYGAQSLYAHCNVSNPANYDHTCIINRPPEVKNFSLHRPALCPKIAYGPQSLPSNWHSTRGLATGALSEACYTPVGFAVSKIPQQKLGGYGQCFFATGDLPSVGSKYLMQFRAVFILNKQEYLPASALSVLREYVTTGGLLHNAGFEFGWELFNKTASNTHKQKYSSIQSVWDRAHVPNASAYRALAHASHPDHPLSWMGTKPVWNVAGNWALSIIDPTHWAVIAGAVENHHWASYDMGAAPRCCCKCLLSKQFLLLSAPLAGARVHQDNSSRWCLTDLHDDIPCQNVSIFAMTDEHVENFGDSVRGVEAAITIGRGVVISTIGTGGHSDPSPDPGKVTCPAYSTNHFG